MEPPTTHCIARPPTELGRKLLRLRPWVQAAFLGVWLAPLSRWVGGIPSCVFHCYSCPLASFACPVGVAANYAALFPAVFEIPYLLIAMLLVAGITVGSLVCGWACPLGFIQDRLGRLTGWKLTLPAWTGHIRYVVLVGLGSMMQTARHVARELRGAGDRVGVVTLRAFRPFPESEIREVLAEASTVVVLDRDIGYGTSGMVYPDLTRSLYHAPRRPRLLNAIIGTGGKEITPRTLARCVDLARNDHGEQTVFWPDARGPAEGIPWTEAPAPSAGGR